MKKCYWQIKGRRSDGENDAHEKGGLKRRKQLIQQQLVANLRLPFSSRELAL
jgi:hypothetical protein